MFIDLLIEKDFPNVPGKDILKFFDDNQITVEFERLIGDNQFVSQLKHYELSFGNSKKPFPTRTYEGLIKHATVGDFTYDVVLTLSDLGKAFNVTTPWISEFDDLIQSKVEEKLGLHTYQQSTESLSPPFFRRWIVFNTREQVFQVVKGITVETLRNLISVKANAPVQASALARARLQNAFSMCNPDGTAPRPVDFDKFHGSFTPEFYLRRFALKDSIYSQRLDVLAILLVHILQRYQTCLPPIRYCELSIGVGDLSRPWVFDVLCSFPAHHPVIEDEHTTMSSFRTMIEKGHFAHLRNACPRSKSILPCTPNVTYKFLAGFNRQTVVAHRIKNQLEALRLLNDSPDVAIHYMLEQIMQSENDEKSYAKKDKSPETELDNKVTVYPTREVPPFLMTGKTKLLLFTYSAPNM
ncbi:unnamed protein product [Didymodactylos carnosus]|uniref:Uncharacterized protein n=1 Tax=Didymodactylos carnosus TaxID=1234261 RepID=A0A815KIN8_9BILA|nr:unnamed protein product [Didymodactylos carnosus]CAF4284978.1 unnamed protein product [Didymodactylos carnosus]